MLSRSLGILVATWLPCLALILPLGPFHTANAIVAGLTATVLAALSLANDRARIGASLVGAWVAFTPLIFRSSFTEIVLSTCWGVTIFVTLSGPFSQTPSSTFVRVIRRAREPSAEERIVLAAA